MNRLLRLALLALPLLPFSAAYADCVKLDPLVVFRAYMLTHPGDFPSSPDFPEPETTIEWIRSGLTDKTVTLSEVTTADPASRWLGIEWGGPIGGILVVADCQGKLLDGSSDGGVDELRAGPVLPGTGATVLVSITDGTGTGYLHKTVTLYAMRSGKLGALWSHDLKDSEFPLSEAGRNTDYQVEFSATGGKIEVHGTTEIYPLVKQRNGSYDMDDKVGKVEHTHESFCWDPQKQTYGSCPKG